MIYPQASIARMDRDTTRKKAAHSAIIRDLQQGKTDILVGTQMITKGLDIAKVTLVGILAADLSLNIPDFRSCERTFQLLTQVSGRTGRGSDPGNVVLQTYNPDHYALKLACTEDYCNFYKRELKIRQQASYPPFCSLLLLRFTCENASALQSFFKSSSLPKILQGTAGKFSGSFYPPTPAPIQRLHGKYRWHSLLKLPNDWRCKEEKQQLYEMLGVLKQECADKKIAMKWDIDPASFL